jgi:hypothetical protein
VEANWKTGLLIIAIPTPVILLYFAIFGLWSDRFDHFLHIWIPIALGVYFMVRGLIWATRTWFS